MSAYISAISYYLPETIVSNQHLLEEFPEWSLDKIAKKIGVVNRHVVNDGQCASDMAEQAAKKLFLEHGIDKDKVDFCCYVRKVLIISYPQRPVFYRTDWD